MNGDVAKTIDVLYVVVLKMILVMATIILSKAIENQNNQILVMLLSLVLVVVMLLMMLETFLVQSAPFVDCCHFPFGILKTFSCLALVVPLVVRDQCN